MKTRAIILICLLSTFAISSCQKDTTTPAKDLTCNVTSTNVTTNGGHDGSITITVLTGNGDYIYSINTTTSNLTGVFTQLTAGVYHVKVEDAEGKTFTKDVTLTEPAIVPVKPTVSTLSSTNITTTSATLNGKVNPNGFNTTLVKFEYGTTTSYGTIVTLSNVTGNTLTDVSGNITGLTPNTLYHYRLVATNSGGTTTSSDMTFTTSIAYVAPTVNTLTTTNISQTSVTLNGKVNANGFTTSLVKFEYGTTTSYGTNVTLSSVSGSTLTDVTTNVTSLTPNTLYHYRLVATNSGGTTNSSDMTFTTLSIAVPIVSNLGSSNITGSSATLFGKVNANGFTTTVKFEYGLTTSYGNTITLSDVSGNTLTDVTTNITNFLPYKTYHYRLVATNSGGTTTSSDMTFTTIRCNVGDEMFGGVIFYTDGTGQHGSVVQKTDYPGNDQNYSNLNIVSNGATWVVPSFSQLQTMFYSHRDYVSVSSKVTSLISTDPYWVSDLNTASQRGWFWTSNPTNLIYHNTAALARFRLITTF